MYLETIDEKGVPTLILDTETDRQPPTDLIAEQDTNKYSIQPNEQEDENDTETISSTSTSTADYDREEVETSLVTIAEAFHMIGNEYE